MTGMVERVARALMSDLSERSGVIDGIDEDILAEMRCTLARAAIEAMREPTPFMLAEGWKEVSKAKTAQGIARLGPGPGLSEAYRAMIDAALNEEGQG